MASSIRRHWCRGKSKAQPSEAFLVKCAREREKLRRQLDADLRRSMQMLLTSRNYTDLNIVASPESGNNKSSAEFNVHSSILKARVPTFYSENCCSESSPQNSIVLPIDKKQFTTFLRKVYCEDDIRVEEVTVNNAINRLSHQNKADVSPSSYYGDSSETYLTPLSSIPNIPEAFEKEQQRDDNMQKAENFLNANYSNMNDTMHNVKCEDQLKIAMDDTANQSYKERRDINVINSLFCKTREEMNLGQSLTDSGFQSQTTSVHRDIQPLDAERKDMSKTNPVYMFVDMNNLNVEKCEKTTPSKVIDPNRQCPVPVSMFVDLNEVETSSKTVLADSANKSCPRVSHSTSMYVDISSNNLPTAESVVSLRRSRSYKIKEVDDEKNGNKEIKAFEKDEKITGISSGVIVQQSKKNVDEISCKSPKSCVENQLLLPMSPIMRRKTQKSVNKTTESGDVKASILPKDIESFKVNSRINSSINLMKDAGTDDEHQTTSAPVPSVASPPSDDSPTEIVARGSNEALSSPPSDIIDDVVNDKSKKLEIKDSTCIDAVKMDVCHKFEANENKSSYVHNEFLVPLDVEDDSETIYSEISDLSSIGGFSNSTVTLHSSKKSSSDNRNLENEKRREYRVRGPCSKLGEDMLRMFLEEINPDVIIEVAGQEIKAHKCILTTRCQYFSAMWRNKLWSESSRERVSLPGFSYAGVHFALCHIYSGATNIPDDSDITELALIADMLGLDGLKDVIVFHLKMSYCHFFHKPCNSCVNGVSECLPISCTYGLTDLHDKAVKWIGQYFARVWPNKSFAALPEELIEKCYQSTLSSLNVDNIVEIVLSCDLISSTLPQVKWSDIVHKLVDRLVKDCGKFIAERFDAILSNENFFILGKGMSWNVVAVEDIITSAVDIISPDVACRSYVILNRILPLAEVSEQTGCMEWTENFSNLLKKIHRQCERYLIHNANRVVHCNSWPLLTLELQQKIKDAAIIVFDFGKPTAPPPRLSSLNRSFRRSKQESCSVIESGNGTNDRKSRSQMPKGEISQKSIDEDLCKEDFIKDPKPLASGSDANVLNQMIDQIPKSSQSKKKCVEQTVLQSGIEPNNVKLNDNTNKTKKSDKNVKYTGQSLSCKKTKQKSKPVQIDESKNSTSPKGVQNENRSPDCHEEESKCETEISSVTSSEWDVNELTSKSIKEAEFLGDALAKKLESQTNDGTEASKSTESEPVAIQNKSTSKKIGSRTRPNSSTVSSNTDPSRPRVRPKTATKSNSSNVVTKVQNSRISSIAVTKVTKDSSNQRKSSRAVSTKVK